MFRPVAVTSRLAQTRLGAGTMAAGRHVAELEFTVPGAGPVHVRVGHVHPALGRNIQAIVAHQSMYFLLPEGSAAAWLVPASMVTRAET